MTGSFSTEIKKLDALEEFRKEFEGASDRASAVVAGAFLDDLLCDLLQEFFVSDAASNENIFEGMGPLATSSAKIEIAYRLGLISGNERRKLHAVRKIRNDFAHKFEITFSHQSIKDRCKNIETPIEMLLPEQAFSEKGEGQSYEIKKADSSDARACFQESVVAIAWALMGRKVKAFDSNRISPPDFVTAYEPAEQLLNLAKREIQSYRQLVETKSSQEQKTKSEPGLQALEKLLVAPIERLIANTKAAHEARLRNN